MPNLYKKGFLWFLAVIFQIQVVSAQQSDYIQFSGVVMTSDSLIGIPFVNIGVKNKNRGTSSNIQGFFSFVAAPGDTVEFSSIGYMSEHYVIPSDLTSNRYSVIQLLTADTVFLPETIIYPWPTRDQLRNAFLNLDIPDDDLERARKNLERETLKEIGATMPMDGRENTDYHLRQQAQRFYYAGQAPPMNIFNVFAWNQFIQAWKRGDFKRQD